MSKAIGVNTMWKKFEPCAMCKKEKMMAHSFIEFSKIRVCGVCYDSIPDHIPLTQDSQYVIAFIKRKDNGYNE
jgi:hypothetical protein